MFNKYDALRLLVCGSLIILVFYSVGFERFREPNSDARVIEYVRGR